MPRSKSTSCTLATDKIEATLKLQNRKISGKFRKLFASNPAVFIRIALKKHTFRKIRPQKKQLVKKSRPREIILLDTAYYFVSYSFNNHAFCFLIPVVLYMVFHYRAIIILDWNSISCLLTFDDFTSSRIFNIFFLKLKRSNKIG